MSTTIGRRVRNREIGTDRRGHRFLDQIQFDAPAPSAIADRAALDLCRAARHADDDARRGEKSRESSTFLMNCFSICSVTVSRR
jgi:hypothetical protein